jgi:predicted DNA binding CopG/RHH family protein
MDSKEKKDKEAISVDAFFVGAVGKNATTKVNKVDMNTDSLSLPESQGADVRAVFSLAVGEGSQSEIGTLKVYSQKETLETLEELASIKANLDKLTKETEAQNEQWDKLGELLKEAFSQMESRLQELKVGMELPLQDITRMLEHGEVKRMLDECQPGYKKLLLLALGTAKNGIIYDIAKKAIGL